MTPADLAQFTTSTFLNQDFIAKILLLIFLSFYVLFSLIFFVQIKRLAHIVSEQNFSSVIQSLSVIHLSFAVILLLASATLI